MTPASPSHVETLEIPLAIDELAAMRRLASDPAKVVLRDSAIMDLVGIGLSTFLVCQEFLAQIDHREKVKKVNLQGEQVGPATYEVELQINQASVYLKLTLCELGEASEKMCVFSAHSNF